MKTPVGREEIVRVRALIDPVFLDSPVHRHAALDTALGCACVLKVETLNPIRSFKGRGAEAVMASLDPRPAHVIATSSGNWGQGLARAAQRRGVGVTIFSEEGDNPGKLDAMRRLGAEVRLVPRGTDGKAAARRATETMGATFVEDGGHPEIAMGAGTLAEELTRQCPELDDVIVPIGDGALITGVGSWFKAASPRTRVVGVTAAGSPAMRLSLEARRPITAPAETIADGIAIHTPVASAVESVTAVVDEIVSVDDEALLDAMALLLRAAGVVSEPAGAAGTAAILRHRAMFESRRVAVIVTGSNVRPELLAEAAGRSAASRPPTDYR
jgi:threonine dehydratase